MASMDFRFTGFLEPRPMVLSDGKIKTASSDDLEKFSDQRVSGF